MNPEILNVICRGFLTVFWSIFISGSGRLEVGDRILNRFPSRKNKHRAVNHSWSRTQVRLAKFSHVWTINNFSFSYKKGGKPLKSPTFTPEDNDEITMCMELYPTGEHNPQGFNRGSSSLGLYLCIVSCNNKSAINVIYELSIIDNEGNKGHIAKSGKIHRPCIDGKMGFQPFITTGKLEEKRRELLPDDDLTILCEGTISVDIVNISEKAESMPFDPSKNEHLFFDHMGRLLESENFSDVTLSVDYMNFRAHKVILAARSPVFSAMFEHEMVEQQENRVVITDINHQVFREILRFIYTDKSSNLETMTVDLLAAADKYALDSLKFMCEMSLSNNLSMKNAVCILILADRHSANHLKRRAINMINAHAKKITKTSDFKAMVQDYPHLLAEVFSTLAICSKKEENK